MKGERLVPAGQAVTITASAPHGHVAAVHAMAAKLGLPALLGPAAASGLALALVISRVVQSASNLFSLRCWPLPLWRGLGVAGASTDDISRRWTGWSTGRTRSRPSCPAPLAPQFDPSRLALFVLSSCSYSHCPFRPGVLPGPLCLLQIGSVRSPSL